MVLSTLGCLFFMSGMVAATDNCPVSCKIPGLAATNHKALASVQTPSSGSCHIGTRNGFPIPDPHCTPGAINPTVSVAVLKNSADFRTCCLRDKVESESDKHIAYGWYGLDAPAHNSGVTQVCELDHLVPLELGGGDSMENIWPQCGPDSVTLNERYFKQKDQVEFYLADQFKAGVMDLAKAQSGIAADYTQFLDAAKAYCKNHPCE
jgi:hypothetical protein